ncbi:ATP-dependent Clp protease ATP-binding subunit [Floricoccus penangensis]|uniref:ATP-dependent Clp protease ATP-binding subunit n=1 Tax=Floricoccus penangensis TaxID=1859475 RepID=UPI0020409337|nr:ATP-dependent Clp protease ATP-binding subunit [Floricoccus penangensis]URZ87719.1 ATP-dependent Clp protease ATP-binding subunit [Floricoccus penangensis]
MKYNNKLKFTPTVEAILSEAEQIALEYKTTVIGSGHLLAAFADFYDNHGSASIHNQGLEKEDIDIELETASLGLPELSKKTTTSFSPRLEELLGLSQYLANENGKNEIGTDHLFYILVSDSDSYAHRILTTLGVNVNKLLKEFLEKTRLDIRPIINRKAVTPASKRQVAGAVDPNSKTPTLDSVARDMTKLARDGKMDPMIGRDKEVERVLQILSRRTKNNPVLVGEPGVGKTAIAEGLAIKLVTNDVPEDLQNKRLMSLEISAVLAGTKFRGEFEDRMTAIIDEVSSSDDVILFIDEIHTIMSSGGGMDGTLDASNILKPALARGDLQLIGSTTFDEYQKKIEKDSALERRLARVVVEEPSADDTVEILSGLKSKYEEYHSLKIEDSAIDAAVKNSVRYMPNRKLPDKAIDLLDEASARVKINNLEHDDTYQKSQEELKDIDEKIDLAFLSHELLEIKELREQKSLIEKKLDKHLSRKKKTNDTKVTELDIIEVVSDLSGVPVSQMTQSEASRLVRLESELHERVIGQDEAIGAVSRAIRRSRSGVSDPRRPIGSFMFLGPTGVGKTELAKALSASVFGSEDNLIRVDMSEYMEKFSTSRLIGAPPGYVGFDEGGQLTEKVRQKPYSVVLLDEIEKAHPDVFNILLQILDDGFVTDSKGRKIDFRNTIIIMTSNIGATALRDEKTVGFGAKDSAADYKAMKSRILEELKKAYRPEFLNRVDETLVFHNLTEGEVQDIVKLMAKSVIERLKEQNINLKVTPTAAKHIAKIGFDPEYGARPLRRAIQREFEDKLSEKLLVGEIKEGDTVTIGISNDKINFKVK